ncbi:MAG: hypothetical protein ABL867_10880 [Rickettsiales bacterium]
MKMNEQSTSETLEKIKNRAAHLLKSETEKEVDIKEKKTALRKVSAQDAEANVKNNPFYKILTKPDLSNEEKVALIRKVLTYDRTQSKEENLERVTLLNELESFLELQRRGHAMQLIELNGSDVYPQLKNTIGKIMDEFGKFQEEISAITGPLQTIEDIRSREGKERVLEALKNANESKKLGEELNARIAQLDGESQNIEKNKSNIINKVAELKNFQEIEKTKKARNFFSGIIGGGAHTAMVAREQEIQAQLLRSNELSKDLEEKKSALRKQVEQLNELEAILAADPNQKKVQDLIDIGTEAYQKRVDDLKESAKAFITFTSENLDTCVARLKMSGEHIDSLETASETYTQYYGLLAQGNRESLTENVKLEENLRAELKSLETDNANDPSIQIKTMETKQLASNLNGYVTQQQSVTETHTVVRNNLAEQQTAIIALKRHNNIALQRAKINLTNGVSTAATHFATVLVAVNSASTAEANDQIGEAFGGVRKMTQETLSAVLGQLVQDISEGRASIVEQTEGIRKLSETLSAVNSSMLSQVKETLNSLDDAEISNQQLKELSERNRAVETTARREHETGTTSESSDTSSDANKPVDNDKFGLNL